MNITKLEAEMINRIVHDLYQPTNGDEPESFADLSSIWADTLLESKADGGVITSLCQKGLAHHSGFVAGTMNGTKRNDATVDLTQAGWDVYVSQIRAAPAAPSQADIDAVIIREALLYYAARKDREAMEIGRNTYPQEKKAQAAVGQLVKANCIMARRARELAAK